MKRVVVGRQSAGFLRRGHPWLRPDRFTRGLDECASGEAVTLVDERGTPLASALADPGAGIAARVYHWRGDRPFEPLAAFERAWQRRADLEGDAATDCYRLVHGEADFLPGLRVERLGPVVVVLVTAACARAAGEAVAAACWQRLPGSTIVLREHLDDLRRAPVSSRRLDGQPCRADDAVRGRELGVTVHLRPFAGLATGIYVDQRATRAWLRSRCQGARVANLFAYTGVFSTSLLAAGAASAVDVDLSAPALALARANAIANGCGDRHQAVQADCQAFLRDGSGLFDLVICDPPTAAQGAGGWLLRRDYPALLTAIRARMAPGGLLVACVNTRGGKPFDLQGAVRSAGFAVVDGPGPGLDLPGLAGFPEGRAFQLVVGRAGSEAPSPPLRDR